MKCLSAALIAGLAGIGADRANAEDVPLTSEEFKTLIVGKTVESVTAAQKLSIKLQLLEGGKAIVSSGFNDVGRWRPYEANGYCVGWSKISGENCYTIGRRDGKLAIFTQQGSFNTWIDAVR